MARNYGNGDARHDNESDGSPHPARTPRRSLTPRSAKAESPFASPYAITRRRSRRLLALANGSGAPSPAKAEAEDSSGSSDEDVSFQPSRQPYLRRPGLLKEIERLETEMKLQLPRISIFRRPLLTLRLFGSYALEQAAFLLKHIIHHSLELAVLLAVFAIIIGSHYIEGPHRQHLQLAKEYVWEVVKWVGLGVASSIGLGTGLHTFVLYLGPHIAMVTMAAVECGTIDLDEDDGKLVCPDGPYQKSTPTVLAIALKVALPAFLWGLGTAIGELPPYFVSRAARNAGEKLAELEEIETEESATFMDKVKKWVVHHLENNAFTIIVLMASIPNPLFDLAGLACGHFGVPFWTFFGATFIGKALVKVSIQSVFIILLFRSEKFFVQLLSGALPFLEQYLHKFEQEQKSRFHSRGAGHAAKADSTSMFQLAWDVFLAVMIGGFLVSIINSIARERFQTEHQTKLAHLRREGKYQLLASF